MRHPVVWVSAGAVLFLLFFLLYSMVSIVSLEGPLVRFASPDETANYFFTTLYARQKSLSFHEPLLAHSNQFVHGRSMTAVLDRVVPVSFVGIMVLYGAIASLVGTGVLLYLTPLLAVLSVLFFFALVEQIFGKRIAFFSAGLLLIHPAYWYFSARAMLPNVLFIDACIIGFALLVRAQRSISYFFAGLFIGSALFVRFSEILWLAGVLLLLFCMSIRRVRFVRSIFFLLGIAVPLAMLFSFNQSLYGNPISFGYQTVDTSTAITSLERIRMLVKEFSVGSFAQVGSLLVSAASSLASYILPFGFTPLTIVAQVKDYFIGMFWWMMIPLGFGILLCLQAGIRETRKTSTLSAKLVYCILFFLISAWLFTFYGSWLVHDNISKQVSIGNSYVRYWLPIYIMSIPFIAQFFIFVYERGSPFRARAYIITLLLGFFVFYSFRLTLWGTNESIFEVVRNIREYQEQGLAAHDWTESNAVIFSARSDKIFFPQRKVAVNYADFREVELVPALVSVVPVYYFGLWEERDAAYISRKYFEPHGLQLRYVAALGPHAWLYKVIIQTAQ